MNHVVRISDCSAFVQCLMLFLIRYYRYWDPINDSFNYLILRHMPIVEFRRYYLLLYKTLFNTVFYS